MREHDALRAIADMLGEEVNPPVVVAKVKELVDNWYGFISTLDKFVGAFDDALWHYRAGDSRAFESEKLGATFQAAKTALKRP